MPKKKIVKKVVKKEPEVEEPRDILAEKKAAKESRRAALKEAQAEYNKNNRYAPRN